MRVTTDFGAHSDHPAGKILQDDKTIESYNIEEKGFIVCMVSRVSTVAQSTMRLLTIS
jgi:hypothetical protein